MLFPSSCPPNYQKKNAPYPPSPLSDSPRAKGCLASSHFQSFLPLTLSALFSSLRKTQSASLSKNPPHSSLVFFPSSVFLQALYYPACSSRMSLPHSSASLHSLLPDDTTCLANNRRRSSRQRPADPHATCQPSIGTSKATYDSALSPQKKTRGWARLFHVAKWAAAWKAPNGGLQLVFFTF